MNILRRYSIAPSENHTPGVSVKEYESRITFRIDGRESSYVFQVDKEGNLEHLYWGALIAPEDDLTYLTKCNIPGLFDPTGILDTNTNTNSDENILIRNDSAFGRERQNFVGKNSKLLEWSDGGTGDFREPSFKVKHKNGSTNCPLKYKDYKVMKGKPDILESALPSVYVESENECTTLEVIMVDEVTDFSVSLFYTVMHKYDIIIRRVQAHNNGEYPAVLEKLVSCTVDFDAEYEYHLTQLSGSWARERHINTNKLPNGVSNVKSVRGTSSHQSNPFVVISSDFEAEEDFGQCFGLCLVYSGNFSITSEISENKRLRVNAGINEEMFSWLLGSKTDSDSNVFCSPEVILSYSGNGLGGLSRDMHRMIRENLIPKQWRYKVPLTCINTWEATYFNFVQKDVVEIAQAAKNAGIELLVLDDGWFGKRDNPTSSLGDWVPYEKKIPNGLNNLVQEVNDAGLEFGIWVEPEMVSADSKLFREHSDWCLRVPDRSLTLGRHQLVLDLTRDDVIDYVYNAMKDLFTSANIKYVKWDMNRHLTDIYSSKLDSNRQGEVSHRFMLGVYKIFKKLTTEFPSIRIETCSGGGGRFDAGMLAFSSQIWTSDNTDALSRMEIQYGTSLAYPLSTMGAHVSAVPNHQTNRSTSMKTRSLLAMCGTFGYELDPRKWTTKDTEEIKSYIEIFKNISKVIYEGDLYRLWNPFKTKSMAWMIVSQDKKRAVAFAFKVQREIGSLDPRLKTRGLDGDKLYNVKELCPRTLVVNKASGALEHSSVGYPILGDDIVLKGKTLERAGLPVNFLFDGDSVCYEFCSK